MFPVWLYSGSYDFVEQGVRGRVSFFDNLEYQMILQYVSRSVLQLKSATQVPVLRWTRLYYYNADLAVRT